MIDITGIDHFRHKRESGQTRVPPTRISRPAFPKTLERVRRGSRLVRHLLARWSPRFAATA